MRAGDVISLNVNLSGSGIFGASGSISYDTSSLELRSIETVIGGSWQAVVSGTNFTVEDTTQQSPISGSTTLFKITFAVKNVSAGTSVSASANITVSDKQSETTATGGGYKTSVLPPLSQNNYLSSLNVSGGTLSPAFDSSVTNYSVSVPFEVSSLQISATSADSSSTVSVYSPQLAPGEVTAASVTVTAQSGASRVYTISVSRDQDPNYEPSSDGSLSEITVSPGILSPRFSADIKNYIVYLPFEVESVDISAVATDEKAEGVSTEGGDNLQVGDNTATVTCIAEDGSETEYSILLRRFDENGEATESYDNNEDEDSVAVIDTEVLKQQIVKSADTGGTVYIDVSNSPIIDGEVFIELAAIDGGKLYIDVGGAKLLFSSEHMINPVAKPYDLSFKQGAVSSEFILPHFANHEMTFLLEFNDIPLAGPTRLDIETNFAPGQIVNVYRYDKQTGELISVAEDITVGDGSVVCYYSDTLGEFVISPEDVSTAKSSDILVRQNELLSSEGTDGGTNIFMIVVVNSLLIGSILYRTFSDIYYKKNKGPNNIKLGHFKLNLKYNSKTELKLSLFYCCIFI